MTEKQGIEREYSDLRKKFRQAGVSS
jgi:hypothetical protein